MLRVLFLSVLLATILPATSQGTTLRVMTEDDQIQSATTIFRGRAEQVEAAFESDARGRSIVTTVRFTPLAVYKGAASAPVALKFLGGKVGDTEMKIGGMPRFQVGQEYILYVSEAGNVVCPVVGWADGSLKVNRTADPAGDVSVSTDVSGRAERAVSPRSRTVLTGKSNRLPEFESRLRARISKLGARP